MDITRGSLVEVTTASGETARMRATSGPESGRDFPIVWVCTLEEYSEGGVGPAGQLGIPWPLDAVVRVLDGAAEREPA